MRVKLNINGGSIEDVTVLRNILNSYDIKADIISNKPEGNEMGAEFLPTLMLLLPEITQFVNVVLPAIKTYIEVRKPTGTKHDIELVNGEKKIHVTNEDGEAIDIDKIVEFCNKTKFFE